LRRSTREMLVLFDGRGVASNRAIKISASIVSTFCLDPIQCSILPHYYWSPFLAREPLPSSTSQFVPFNKNDQFSFKDRRDRLVEPTPQEAQPRKRA
jgi:hypothetical protein